MNNKLKHKKIEKYQHDIELKMKKCLQFQVLYSGLTIPEIRENFLLSINNVCDYIATENSIETIYLLKSKNKDFCEKHKKCLK